MSAQSYRATEETNGARVLEISELPVSHIRGYAADVGEVHFERRGDRTFLVRDR
ncbi:MAG: hypothetical protein RI560_03165 [Natronomonas sp.]|jgi:hypothetical protein|uniref:hypothetical protein n=1 Tax=Natronomonas sp. TaxID=2184060 RepID=UPI0028703610|nr:hypothetical protein [Natronomonas sp.]MDR9380658.1 hypothetical protein [Natronomonas sp.]MDR9430507.1 hypothetical protein [Natronomonas sp.]